MAKLCRLAVSAILAMLVASAAPARTKAPAEEPADEGGGYPWISEPDELAENTKRFNAGLAERKIRSRITNCRWGVDVAVGTARSNHSYGAVCTLRDGRRKRLVKICDDVMVGHFRMEDAPPGELTDDDRFRDIVAFVREHCYGG